MSLDVIVYSGKENIYKLEEQDKIQFIALKGRVSF